MTYKIGSVTPSGNRFIWLLYKDDAYYLRTDGKFTIAGDCYKASTKMFVSEEKAKKYLDRWIKKHPEEFALHVADRMRNNIF